MKFKKEAPASVGFTYIIHIIMILLILLVGLISDSSQVESDSSKDNNNGLKNKTELINNLINYCIDSENHKSLPGPEDGLHSQCSPWRNRSCCTSTTTVDAHYKKMYNFDWDHCSHVSPLSSKCKQHFIQDLCFYECSPNVGPWAVKINQSFRKERFMDVPLCATDCDNWFNDCADDVTCTDNWGLNFHWEDGINKCPVGSTCKAFSKIFKNSEEFCEKIWDYSWKYTSNDEYCMRLWFNPIIGNPNDKVAQWKVQQLIGSSSLSSLPSSNCHFGATHLLLLVIMTILSF